MTGQNREGKVDRYVRAVLRHLYLKREYRERVAADPRAHIGEASQEKTKEHCRKTAEKRYCSPVRIMYNPLVVIVNRWFTITKPVNSKFTARKLQSRVSGSCQSARRRARARAGIPARGGGSDEHWEKNPKPSAEEGAYPGRVGRAHGPYEGLHLPDRAGPQFAIDRDLLQYP